MAGPDSEQGTAAGEWWSDDLPSQQQPMPPSGSGSSSTRAAQVPAEAHNLVKEVYKAFGKNRVMVPSHLRHLLDSLSPKPWQDQVKGEAWKLTRIQQKLEKLLSAHTMHKKAWQDFEADLQKYHQRNHLVYVDGLKALDEDILKARQDEKKASSELQTLTAAHPLPAATHLVPDSDEEGMDHDGQGTPTHSEANEMERHWYEEEEAAATAAAQLHHQQTQAAAAAYQFAQQQEAHHAAAQQTAFLQTQAAAEAAMQQAAFHQAQSAAAEALLVAQQRQAAQQAAQQQAWQQQQQLLDLQRMQAAQAQREQVPPSSEGGTEQAQENEDADLEEEKDQVLPTFTPVTMSRGSARRAFRSTSEGKRQATEGFLLAPLDKKKD